MRAILVCVCILLKYSQTNVQAEWVKPYFNPVITGEVNKIKDELISGFGEVELEFNEEVEVGFVLGELTYIGNVELEAVPGTKFTLSKNKNNKFELISKYKFDYESNEDRTYNFSIASDVVVQFTINIRNTNDNPLEITAGSCTIEEGDLSDDKQCDDFKIFDKDGISEDLKLNNLDEENAKIFIFECVDPCVREKEAKIILKPKMALDYEKVTRYNFDWIVTDGVHTDTARVQINVWDMPDEDPVWREIQKSIQFEEKKKQTFTFTAVDGDTGVNDDIIYDCLEVPEPLDTKMTCRTVDESLVIEIEEIDRDEKNLNILKFKVSACEATPPKACNIESIVFLIDDINDNTPVISITGTQPVLLDENRYQDVDITIEIKDLDLADEGTFDVELKCEDVKEIESALQVIPGTGYREGKFSLSIIDATILDYDRKDKKLWNFNIQIIATEKADSSHVGKETVKIQLVNWNDEDPTFKKNKYEPISLSELFGRNGSEPLEITDLVATDDDYEDEVTYALVGSINNILELENEKVPKIRSVKASDNVQLFDYEKQKTVTFQVEASDNFQNNVNPDDKRKKYAEITINLIDANDEPPVITLSENTIELEENSGTDTDLGITVTVSDPDEKANLEVKIDWTKSYATKYGKPEAIFNEDYSNSFVLEKTSTRQKEITYRIKVKDVQPGNTPDYEKFDTIYLQIVVTDRAQEWGSRSSEAILIVTVKDLNDNKPFFIREVMDVERKIKENPDLKATIGMVAANDDDVKTEFEFSLRHCDDYSSDKINVDQKTRMLYVSVDDIDAEELFTKLKSKFLKYEICVSDGDVNHLVCEDLDIYVVDENDEEPYFVNPPTEKYVKEHSPIDTPVLTFEGKDDDRDHPNNEVLYYLEPKEYQKYFMISEDKGEITIIDDLDREGSEEEFNVTIVIKDNPDNPKMQKEKRANFKIILEDINDKIPEILTTEIKTSEKLEAGETVYTVKAFDKDKPGTDNTKIKFEILDLVDCFEDLDKSFFKIETDKNYLSGEGTITALKPLKNMYTECKMEIQTTDFGQDPKTDTKKIPFIIEKYNFNKPQFTYPTKKSIYLKPDQPAGNIVKLFDGTNMPAIKARHEREDKYKITFSLASDSEGQNVFSFREATQTSAFLILQNNYEWKGPYNVIILAQDEGEPPLSNRYEVKIGVYSTEQEPVFDVKDRQIDFEFNETIVGDELTLPKASLEVDDEEIAANLDIYYSIYEDHNKAFTLRTESDTPIITLMEPLFVVNLTSKVLKVVASKSENVVPTTVDEASIVTINLTVIDINDNPPVFKTDQYSSGVMLGFEIGRVITTVEATDLDNDTTLTYTILKDTYEAIGSGISPQNEFDLEEDSGKIKLNFEVLQNMKGYFIFDVNVTDSLHYDTTNVKIYIISDENEVTIRFDNTFEKIKLDEKYIEGVLSDVLGYSCSSHGITEAADESGNPIEDVTDVKVHCIDPETNLPATESAIKTQLNSQEAVGKLRTAFNERELRLSQVKEVIIPENMEEQLKIWLVCVSVVLGSLCVILIVAFILKTRSLVSRISKLTTIDFADDDKNFTDSNTHVPAAPNTNRRAVEGSNPVFNTNFEERDEADNYDKQSISSGDSDFLGIENNPAFDN